MPSAGLSSRGLSRRAGAVSASLSSRTGVAAGLPPPRPLPGSRLLTVVPSFAGGSALVLCFAFPLASCVPAVVLRPRFEVDPLFVGCRAGPAGAPGALSLGAVVACVPGSSALLFTASASPAAVGAVGSRLRACGPLLACSSVRVSVSSSTAPWSFSRRARPCRPLFCSSRSAPLLVPVCTAPRVAAGFRASPRASPARAPAFAGQSPPAP